MNRNMRVSSSFEQGDPWFRHVDPPQFTYTVELGTYHGFRTVNQYVIGERLGQGTYGRVYRAAPIPSSDADGGEITYWPFAIKAFNRKQLYHITAHCGTGIDLIRHEFSAHSALQQLGIIPRSLSVLLEVIDAPDAQYTYSVMINYKRGSAGPYLTENAGVISAENEQSRPMTLDEAREATRDILLALRFMHLAGVAHHDVKPSNIILDTSEQNRTYGYRAILTDLSVAHYFESVDEKGVDDTRLMDLQRPSFMWTVMQSMGLADYGMVERMAEYNGRIPLPESLPIVPLGTAAFQPPEFLSVVGNCVPTSHDMWSLGICLYSWVKNRFPFDPTDPVTHAYLIRQAEPDYSDLPPLLVDLLKRLLEKSPERRITSTIASLHPWITDYGRVPPAHIPCEGMPFNDSPMVQFYSIRYHTDVPPEITIRTFNFLSHILGTDMAHLQLGRAAAILRRRNSMSDADTLYDAMNVGKAGKHKHQALRTAAYQFQTELQTCMRGAAMQRWLEMEQNLIQMRDIDDINAFQEALKERMKSSPAIIDPQSWAVPDREISLCAGASVLGSLASFLVEILSHTAAQQLIESAQRVGAPSVLCELRGFGEPVDDENFNFSTNSQQNMFAPSNPPGTPRESREVATDDLSECHSAIVPAYPSVTGLLRYLEFARQPYISSGNIRPQTQPEARSTPTIPDVSQRCSLAPSETWSVSETATYAQKVMAAASDAATRAASIGDAMASLLLDGVALEDDMSYDNYTEDADFVW